MNPHAPIVTARAALARHALALLASDGEAIRYPVCIRVRDGERATEIRIRIAAAKGQALLAGGDDSAGAGDAADSLSPCESDIVAAIRATGQRLAAEALKRALQDADKVHGDSTITKALARLVQRKRLLTNRADSYGRGYGLADWC